MLKIVHKAEFARAAANNRTLVVKFGATWCSPCKAYAPIFEAAESKFDDKVAFAECDVDYCDMVDSLNIRNVPTTIVFVDAIEVERRSGALTAKDLEALVVSHL